MSLDPRSALQPASVRLSIDKAALSAYLSSSHLFAEPVRAGELTVQQFGYGQSNPTYLVQVHGKELVLRKQPPGKLLPSAHQVAREFRVIAALQNTAVPVPVAVRLCTDSSVLGAHFYLMSFVDGIIYTSPGLPGVGASQRRALYRSTAGALAALHSVDPAAVGLHDYGHAAKCNARQVVRWARQYASSTEQGTGNARQDSMAQLAQRLGDAAPMRDAALSRPLLVHGDFRLDNLVFSTGKDASVKAVLDWELSTLGDPLSDLAYCCMAYHMPVQMSVLAQLPDPLPEGIPSEEDFIQMYCSQRSIEPPPAAIWAFYIALALFRAAAILAGVYSRALQGNASSADARTVGAPSTVDAMAKRALQMLTASGAGGASQVKARQEEQRAEARPLWPQPPTQRASDLVTRLEAFMSQHVLPVRAAFREHAHSGSRWQPFPHMDTLKQAARTEGLWNLWVSPDLRGKLEPCVAAARLPESEAALLLGPGLSNAEYAHCAKVMGRVLWCSEVFNCSAPDTGNMEVLARYGAEAQQREWLLPLLRGDIRSCFAMTEPDVASSDATNIRGSITKQGGKFCLNGRKVWISGALDSRCKVCIFMGKSDTAAAPHKQQSMVLVPMGAPGVRTLRPMTVFGNDDAPHGHAEMRFDDVRVPASSIVLGEGRGFEIAQGRLGPGRLHHCMRAIGAAEVALAASARRVQHRHTFGAPLAHSPLVHAQLADAWLAAHSAWLSVLHAAAELDMHGNTQARLAITAAKAVVPQAVLQVIDAGIQLHGAAGVSQDEELAELYGAIRTLRLADGPDEVHRMAIGKQVIKLASKL